MVNSVSAALPGGFSSVWINQEKTQIGDRLLQNDAYNRAVGGSLNLGALWSPLGTLSASYNDDKKNDSHYYNADYYQNIFTGRFGTLGVRAGVQRYNNGSSNANTGKYIALDFSLPMGNWLSAGVSNQNGYTTANRAARKDIKDGPIRTPGPTCRGRFPVIPAATTASTVVAMRASTPSIRPARSTSAAPPTATLTAA